MKLDAKKFINTLEQRFISNDISLENFRPVVASTLTGNILDWYNQNEHLFVNWLVFKTHFKV